MTRVDESPGGALLDFVGRSISRWCHAVLLAGLGLSGCSQNNRTAGDGHIEPRSGAEYLIGRPSNYNPTLAWPLVVLCHSGFADSPKRQITEWTKLADERGFIIVAPQLEHPRRTLDLTAAGPADAEPGQTRMILNVVEHVRAAHNVSEDRVLLYGVGRGAQAALEAGLSHPETFRAVSVNEPILEGDSRPGPWTQVDPYQTIHVRFSRTDRLYHKRYEAVVDWLRSIGANPHVDTAGSSDADRPARAVAFFELLLRKEPWLVVRATHPDASRPLTIQFRLQTSLASARLSWDLGDGQRSADAEPVHEYAAPGVYEINVTASGPDGRNATRSVWLSLPDGTVCARKPTG